jgi:hypothetical protein
VAFYSADTVLTLSNTSGASDLLDPLGALLSQTDEYGTAKDGQAWALANGTWYWTLQATPGKSNTIAQATTAGTSTSSKSSKAKSSKTSSAKVKSASTGKSSTTPLSVAPASEVTQTTPVHPWTLAAIAGLAVAYGLYEYRLDISNFFHRFKRHRALSRANG